MTGRAPRSWVTWRAGELRARHLAVVVAALVAVAAAIVHLLPAPAPSGARPGQPGVVQVHVVPAPGPARPGADRPTARTAEAAPPAVEASSEPAPPREPPEDMPQSPPRIERILASAGAAGPPLVLDEPPPLFADQPPRHQGPIADYQRVLFDHIKRFRHYPDAARAGRLHGVVTLVFVMSRDGGLLEMRIADSSGSPVLDRSALEMMRRARPLPAIPANLPDHVKIILPVDYAPDP